MLKRMGLEIAVALMAIILLISLSYASTDKQPTPSVGKLMQLNVENYSLNKSRNEAYQLAKKRHIKGLALNRVKWINQRNAQVYDRVAGTINVVLLNEMLKQRIEALQAM